MRPQNVILIDGHNWIHQVPFLASCLADAGEESARMRAIGQAGVYANTRRGVQVWLLFDGNRHGGGRAGGKGAVRVRFSSPPRTADDDIVAMGEKLARQKVSVTVVTDDRGIHARLAGIGIAFEGAAAFWGRITARAAGGGTGGDRGRPDAAAEDGARKESALTPVERAELDALLARSAEERQARDRERDRAKQDETDAVGKRGKAMPPPRAPGPAVQGRASREDRRRRYEEKKKRSEATHAKPKPRKRKKRRGY